MGVRMADFAELLQDYTSIVVDYSAFLEFRDPAMQEALVGSIVAQQKTVFVSGGFKAFHECVIKANNPNERAIVYQTRHSLKCMADAKLMRVSKSASTVDFFLEHLGNENECFFIGRNSSSFTRLRNINAQRKSAIFVIDQGRIRFYPTIDECMEEEPGYSVNPISGNSDFIASSHYFSVGDYVYTDDDQRLTLTSLISTGAEGLVFCTEDDHYVAKVYHKGGITPLRWYKLMKMRQLGLNAVNICWPYKLLYSNEKMPVGYLMKKASGSTISRAFDGPDAMEENFPCWERVNVVESAISFLRIMDYMHLHGVLAGDIQLKNAMIDDDSQVYLIDIDSVQYQDLPCPVGTEEFTRPELWDKSFVSFLRRPQDEDYSVAILVFSMLFCGQHPYAQRNGLETLRDEMEARSFPYTVDDSQNERIPLGGYDKIWDALTPTLKDMFVRAFAKGELFDCVEWTVALEEYRDKLNAHEYDDPEVYRVFPYYVEEADTPLKKKGGKMGIREAVMSSSMNTPEAANSYARQVPLHQEEKPKPKPEQAHLSFKGSSNPPPQTHIRTSSGQSGKPATSSALANRMSAQHTSSAPAPAQNGEKAAEQAKPEQKKGLAAFFKKKRWNLALYLSLAFGIELLRYFK